LVYGPFFGMHFMYMLFAYVVCCLNVRVDISIGRYHSSGYRRWPGVLCAYNRSQLNWF
jgi:hypothetical protein